MLFVANFLSFCLLCGVFFLLDIILNCEHYRIIPRTRAQLLQLYRDSLPVVLRNQLFSALYLGVYEYLLVLVPPDRGETERTNATWVLLLIKFIVAFFVVSFLLTGFHLIYHKYSNGKYFWIHKKHHEHRAPIGISAFYSSLLEHVITLTHGLLTLAALRLTHWESCLALAAFNLGIISGHSGYSFLPIARYHNIHHQNVKLHFADSSWMEGLFQWGGGKRP